MLIIQLFLISLNKQKYIAIAEVLHEALETECAKCSEHQKEVVKKVIKFLAQNKRDVWNELKQKYDPDGKYVNKYADLADKEHVQL
jgi:dsDNA-binding SOS-regulon protein